MDINQLRFLEEIEHDLYLESKINDEDQGSVIKTKYDMKSSRNVISNSMHEALGKPFFLTNKLLNVKYFLY